MKEEIYTDKYYEKLRYTGESLEAAKERIRKRRNKRLAKINNNKV